MKRSLSDSASWSRAASSFWAMRVSLCLSGFVGMREMWRGMKIEEKRTLMSMIVFVWRLLLKK